MKDLAKAIGLSVVLVVLAGCAKSRAVPTFPNPEVTVEEATSRNATEFDEFTGHIEAVDRVELRPRVSGYISAVKFAEGANVRKGDILFVIDPRPYAAELKRAQAGLARANAAATLAATSQKRGESLASAHVIAAGEMDTLKANLEQARAAVQAALAEVETAAMNLDFSRVQAPVSGVVAKAEVTPGNLVNAGDSILTTIVSVDPVYVVFDADARRLLNPRVSARRTDKARLAEIEIWVEPNGEVGNAHLGKLVFVNNEVNSQTGTIHARGLLENTGGSWTPGMFARIKVARGAPQDLVLINDKAIATDQALKVAYVLDPTNRVERRTVALGSLLDGQRVVHNGLLPGDRVVTSGLQHIRPGVTVTPISATDKKHEP